MQKKALITGLNGFTGRYLAHELGLAGYRVFGTAHVNEQVEQDMVAVNLCNREELRHAVAEVRPDVVAHLAAISFVAHGDVDAIYRTNVVVRATYWRRWPGWRSARAPCCWRAAPTFTAT